MARYLFIAQKTLDTWMEQDKIEFDKNIMTIKTDGRSFKLVEAVRFIQVEGGAEDRPGLLGRVKTDEQLRQMGAERYRDSVLFEDIPYKVQEGFIAEVFLRQQAAAEPAPARPAPPQPRAAAPAPPPQPAQGQPPQRGRTQAAKTPPAPAAQAEVGKSRPAVNNKKAQAAAGAKDDKELSDEELLTRFLLDNL